MWLCVYDEYDNVYIIICREGYMAGIHSSRVELQDVQVWVDL